MVSDHGQLCRLLKEYYSNVFSGEGIRACPSASAIEDNLVILDDQNAILTANLEFEEFTEAIKSMHPDKASGPNGLNPAFFQHFWKQVGKEVFESCREWLLDCKFC